MNKLSFLDCGFPFMDASASDPRGKADLAICFFVFGIL